jgi:hypothetical protein
MFRNNRNFYHSLSLRAQRSLLQISITAKPTPISLENLLKVNPNWIQKELPFRYMHLIKFLSMRSSKVEPLLDRYLKDVDLLANTGDLLADYSNNTYQVSAVPAPATGNSNTANPNGIPIFASTSASIKELTRLKERNMKSLDILKSLSLDKETTEQILTLNYGVEILLDEYIALVAKKQNLVEKVNVIDVSNEVFLILNQSV